MQQQVMENSVLPARDSEIARRRRKWREFKDKAARFGVTGGGLSVILAIVLIFFYLLYVVIPLFSGAHVEVHDEYDSSYADTQFVTLNEYNDVALAVSKSGQASFFESKTGKEMLQADLPVGDKTISAITHGDPTTGIFAYGFEDGSSIIFQQKYKISYPNDVRKITPQIIYPLGEGSIQLDAQGKAIKMLAVNSGEEKTTFVGLTEDNRLIIKGITKEVDFLDEEQFTLVEDTAELALSDEEVTHVKINLDQRALFLVNAAGELSYYDVSNVSSPNLIQKLKVVPAGVSVTSFEFLTGGVSVLVGRSDGKVDQWFPVRDENNNYVMHNVRGFAEQSNPIVQLLPEQARKGFLALDSEGNIGVYHTTAHRTLLVEPFFGPAEAPVLALSPRANGLISISSTGHIKNFEVENEHPDISWHSLWEKVWYESRNQPEHIWQSSSASNDFEPKFSLTPLTFGTIKAAFYAMLVAVPLAIMGAIYTAYFMSPKMRVLVKPAIEIMEALPTVILGFLAGLWLAPIVESNLPGVFTLLFLLPVMIIITAWAWTKLPKNLRERIPDGWEAALLIPTVIVVGIVSLSVSASLEQWLFNGNMPQYLNDIGIDFDQRNSLVVGLVMGFAVIPTIFSITEDAIFGVPKHLTVGSLALGATPWQTMTRVVLLTASPGIFSAVMIGLGRAVGETMIVLMATGNTPIMDFNIFEGFRALSANIAVEMPESEVDSSHYRVLFLAALVLFMATFVLNTLAEVVRQRLRKKYSSL